MKRFLTIITLFIILLFSHINPVAAQSNPTESVVQIVMFWMEGCPYCHEVLENILPALQDQYGEQLEIQLIEVVTLEDTEYLFKVGAAYGIGKDQVGVPLLLIGDHVLIGSDQIPAGLPRLIESYLAQDGVGWPALPEQSTSSEAADPLMNSSTIPSAGSSGETASGNLSGFSLAIATMIGLVIVLVYSLTSFAIGKTISLPAWVDWLTPVLIVIGIGVAAYMTYIETQSVEAICGPLGDCNSVQQSSYATLFGFLPVGVLGLIGYVGLLGAWLVRRFAPAQEKLAALAFWGMSIFAVVFSIYLTYLELFVIKAVCLWCISSAIIVTGLLLLGTPPVVRHYMFEDD